MINWLLRRYLLRWLIKWSHDMRVSAGKLNGSNYWKGGTIPVIWYFDYLFFLREFGFFFTISDLHIFSLATLLFSLNSYGYANGYINIHHSIYISEFCTFSRVCNKCAQNEMHVILYFLSAFHQKIINHICVLPFLECMFIELI